MKAYLDLLGRIYTRGVEKRPTRIESGQTKNKTIGLPHLRFDHDLADGFPFITTRQMWWKGMAGELRSFIEGRMTQAEFEENGCTFWKEWANNLNDRGIFDPEAKQIYRKGDLGPVYGAQWNAHGQLDHVLSALKRGGDDRRMVVSAWRPDEHERMALPPCHVLWNVVVYGGKIHMHWHQRSCDFPVGVPTNIASYALLTHLLAKWSGLSVGGLSANFADAHIYENQHEGIVTQLSRSPHKLPMVHVEFKDDQDFESWTAYLSLYKYHPAIDFGELEV
jgi:thymidylate synthase